MDYYKTQKYAYMDPILMVVFLAALMDYFLTYWGVRVLQCIEELNPLMNPIIQLPLYQGLAVRIVTISTLLLTMRFALSKVPGSSPRIKYLVAILSIQIIPAIAHGIWLLKVFVA